MDRRKGIHTISKIFSSLPRRVEIPILTHLMAIDRLSSLPTSNKCWPINRSVWRGKFDKRRIVIEKEME